MSEESSGGATPPEYVTIHVRRSQLVALRDAITPGVDERGRPGPSLTDDELYSAAAIAVLLYIGDSPALPGVSYRDVPDVEYDEEVEPAHARIDAGRPSSSESPPTAPS